MKLAIWGLTACGKTYHARKISHIIGLKYISASTILAKVAKMETNKPHFWISSESQELNRKRQINHNIDKTTDQRVLEILKRRDDIILDSWTAPWLYKEKDLIKICILSDIRARTEMAYMSTKEKPFDKKRLREKIEKKDADNKKLFKAIYGIDITNLSVFDIKLDISRIYRAPREATNQLIALIQNYTRNYKKVFNRKDLEPKKRFLIKE